MVLLIRLSEQPGPDGCFMHLPTLDRHHMYGKTCPNLTAILPTVSNCYKTVRAMQIYFCISRYMIYGQIKISSKVLLTLCSYSIYITQKTGLQLILLII